jgi:hypothetical protein
MPTSQRKIDANRRNARLSTGPRSRAGKARSSRNAMRHGLAGATVNRAIPAELHELAALLAGKDSGGQRMLEACRVAEATLQVRHIRRLRANMINRAVATAGLRASCSGVSGGTAAGHDDPLVSLAEPERVALAVAAIASDLERVDRYERRALSRRKMAARRL